MFCNVSRTLRHQYLLLLVTVKVAAIMLNVTSVKKSNKNLLLQTSPQLKLNPPPGPFFSRIGRDSLEVSCIISSPRKLELEEARENFQENKTTKF